MLRKIGAFYLCYQTWLAIVADVKTVLATNPARGIDRI